MSIKKKNTTACYHIEIAISKHCKTYSYVPEGMHVTGMETYGFGRSDCWDAAASYEDMFVFLTILIPSRRACFKCP